MDPKDLDLSRLLEEGPPEQFFASFGDLFSDVEIQSGLRLLLEVDSVAFPVLHSSVDIIENVGVIPVGTTSPVAGPSQAVIQASASSPIAVIGEQQQPVMHLVPSSNSRIQAPPSPQPSSSEPEVEVIGIVVPPTQGPLALGGKVMPEKPSPIPWSSESSEDEDVPMPIIPSAEGPRQQGGNVMLEVRQLDAMMGRGKRLKIEKVESFKSNDVPKAVKRKNKRGSNAARGQRRRQTDSSRVVATPRGVDLLQSGSGLPIKSPGPSAIAVMAPLAVVAPLGINPNILKMKKPRKCPIARQNVPEDKKDSEYFANRKRNTEASRLSRERKRALDAERVALLNDLVAENAKLKAKASRMMTVLVDLQIKLNHYEKEQRQ